MTAVTADNRCRVCGGDHKCSFGDGGLLICGRNSDAVEGFVYLGQAAGDDQFGLYREAGGGGNARGRRPNQARQAASASAAEDWATRIAECAKRFCPDRRTELAGLLRLPVEVLDWLPGLGYLSEVKFVGAATIDDGCWTFPERDAQGRPVGVIRRYRDGRKQAMKGGRRGLCLPIYWRAQKGPVYLVEGPSDALAMTAAELAAVGRPSNCGGADELVKLLRDMPKEREIYVIGENDQKADGTWPGRKGAESLAGRLARGLGRQIKIAFPPAGAKDVRAWLTQSDRVWTPWPDRGRALAAELVTAAEVVTPDAVLALITDDAGGTDPTDAERGRRFVDLFGGRVRYVEDWAAWCVFDDRRWVRDPEGIRVQRLAFDHGGSLRKNEASNPEGQLANEATTSPDAPSDAGALTGGVEKWLSMRSVQSLLAAARSDPRVFVPVGADVFDTHPHLLNVANGTIDLRTGVLGPHTPEDFLTVLCPTAFEPDAACPAYDRFLDGLFPGRPAVAQFVRDFGGYALTGETCDQSYLVFAGEGSNGKSVLLELWGAVLGNDLTYHAPPELLVDGGPDRHPTERASLRGKRLVVCSETEEEGCLNERRLKSLTGSDTITARFCRQDFHSFIPTFKLVLATNYLPRVRGTDHGTWRRLRLVEFLRKFWTPADCLANPVGDFRPEDQADASLPTRLRGAAAGVLAAMVRAAIRFYAAGRRVTPPEEVMNAVAEYRRDEDLIGQFFAERVRPTAAPSLAGAEFYAAFQDWLRKQGYAERYLIGPKKFGREAKRKFDVKKCSRQRYAVRVLSDSECECHPAWDGGSDGRQFRVDRASETDQPRAMTSASVGATAEPPATPPSGRAVDQASEGAGDRRDRQPPC
ncbi:phage/plasmid primase, P4 family [Limnoglobus roseus]|nr:phage/plasmid primase, P4 family [Limnoglobus roseus]